MFAPFAFDSVPGNGAERKGCIYHALFVLLCACFCARFCRKIESQGCAGDGRGCCSSTFFPDVVPAVTPSRSNTRTPMSFLSHYEFAPEGPLWCALGNLLKQKGSPEEAAEYVWSNRFFLFYTGAVYDERKAVVMENNTVFDRGRLKTFPDLHSWWLSVAEEDTDVPFSALCYGKPDGHFLTSEQIRRALGWRHNPFTAAPAPAPVPGAGAAVDIPVDESTTVGCLARRYEASYTRGVGGTLAPRSTGAGRYETRQAAFERRSDEEVAATILLLGRWLQASAVTEWSPDVERQLTDAGLADGAPIVKALLTLRSS